MIAHSLFSAMIENGKIDFLECIFIRRYDDKNHFTNRNYYLESPLCPHLKKPLLTATPAEQRWM